jgi:REP element-mobilizing transposase RayT
MDIGRKKLSHDLPPNIIPNPEHEVYFITVCCEQRGYNQLAEPRVWAGILETIQHREQAGDCKVSLLLVMPDHWHGLISFPGPKSMEQVIGNIKSWLKRSQRIVWQSGFFDHRLRTSESAQEKRQYILNNPVRAGLINDLSDWPYKLDLLEKR